MSGFHKQTFEGELWDLLDFDPILQRSTWGRTINGKLQVRTETKVQGVLEANKEAKSNYSHQKTEGIGRCVASIPIDFAYDDFGEAHKQRDDAWLTRWLNDSDNSAFRTTDTRV